MFKPRFQPTHIITHKGYRFLVQLVDGVLYEYHDWKYAGTPDWELEDGRLLFQGQPSPANICEVK